MQYWKSSLCIYSVPQLETNTKGKSHYVAKTSEEGRNNAIDTSGSQYWYLGASRHCKQEGYL